MDRFETLETRMSQLWKTSYWTSMTWLFSKMATWIEKYSSFSPKTKMLYGTELRRLQARSSILTKDRMLTRSRSLQDLRGISFSRGIAFLSRGQPFVIFLRKYPVGYWTPLMCYIEQIIKGTIIFYLPQTKINIILISYDFYTEREQRQHQEQLPMLLFK